MKDNIQVDAKISNDKPYWCPNCGTMMADRSKPLYDISYALFNGPSPLKGIQILVGYETLKAIVRDKGLTVDKLLEILEDENNYSSWCMVEDEAIINNDNNANNISTDINNYDNERSLSIPIIAKNSDGNIVEGKFEYNQNTVDETNEKVINYLESESSKTNIAARNIPNAKPTKKRQIKRPDNIDDSGLGVKVN